MLFWVAIVLVALSFIGGLLQTKLDPSTESIIHFIK
jgi:hypothetical protein